MPITDGRSILGFQVRKGAESLLRDLSAHYRLVLWTVSSRAYVEKALGFGLGRYFHKWYTWDDCPSRWKDVRSLCVDYLVDDSEHHLEVAKPIGFESKYILVPAYGSRADMTDPDAWSRIVRGVLLPTVR